MSEQQKGQQVIQPEAETLSNDVKGMGKNVIVAITGGTGALYALRVIRMLVLNRFGIELIMTEYAHYTLFKECGVEIKPSTIKTVFPDLMYIESSFTFNNNLDLKSPLLMDIPNIYGMVIVPCSMNYISAIASSSCRSLIEKCADSSMSHSKPLVIVPSHTPFNKIHLKNMLSIMDAGGKLVPAMPEFDNIPKSFNDLADNIARKVLDMLEIKTSETTYEN